MKKIIAVTSILLSSQLMADEAEPTIDHDFVITNQWEWNFSILQASFDNKVLKQGIDTSAIGFGVHADYIQNNWITTFSGQYLSYDDNNSFKQSVVGSGWSNKGDESTQGSDASGLLLGIATGHMYFFGKENDIALIAQAGIDFMVGSERSISLCDNCQSEDIDVEGGFYLKAGVVKDTGPFSVGLHAKSYVSSDDIGTIISISIGSTY